MKVNRTIELSVALDVATNVDDIRQRVSETTGESIDASTTIFASFHTNLAASYGSPEMCLSITV